MKLQVRASDCDHFGHVNNAIYVDFLEHCLAAALSAEGWANDWQRNSGYQWQLKSLSIEFRRPVQFGSLVEASLWLDEYDEIRPRFGFELHLADPDLGQNRPPTVARARAAWERQVVHTGEPVPLPEKMLDSFGTKGGSLPRVVSPPNPSADAKSYEWEHEVMRSELAPSGVVHPRALLNWVEEAVFSASASAGWTVDRMLEAGFLVFQTRHDTEILTAPGVGDRLRVVSRLADVRRLLGTWYHEIYHRDSDDLLVRDYTTGVFLDLNGHPATPPAGLLSDIQVG